MPPEDEEDTVNYVALISFSIPAFDDEQAKEYAQKICEHYPGYEPEIESIDEED